MNEISEEDAVKVVEWLGFEKAEIEDSRGNKYSPWLGSKDKQEWSKGRIHKWLSSPEGEVAMMDKLEELAVDHNIEELSIFCARGGNICVWIGIDKGGNGHYMEGEAKTRNQALQLAILGLWEDQPWQFWR